MKKIIALMMSLILVITLFACTPSEKAVHNVAGQCSITVDCKDLLDKTDALPEKVRAVLPQDGVFLAHEGIDFYEGETAHDLLLRLAKHEKLPVDFSDTQYGVYIKGIGSLYASDAGETSGWLYSVNGESMQFTADAYILQPGDEIRFYYLQDFMHGM